MAYFEDLQPCTAFPGEWRKLLAVGWLSKAHEFTKRPDVDVPLLGALSRIPDSQPPNAPTGTHRCDLCGPDQPNHEGSGALFVPARGVLYVAPRMILHYVGTHGYVPPPAFVRAVGACRELGRQEHAQAIMRHLAGYVPPPPAPPPSPTPVVYQPQRVAILEGIEPVRMRPGMYIGGTGPEGLGHMLFELVGNSLDQHLAGKATRLSIDIDRSGTITIEDDGPGIRTDVIAKRERPFIELAFTTLHFTPTMDEHYPHVHARSGLYGAGAGVISALSSRMEVETRREGRHWAISFERGKTVKQLTDLGPTTTQGTRIRYHPDPEIFEGARQDLRAVRKRLVQLAGLTPKLDIRFQGKSLQRPEGLAGWLRELAPRAVKETALVASGTHEGVIVEAAFAWTPRARGKTPKVLSFVNCSETRLNGSHVKGLLAAVRATPPSKIDQDRVMRGLVALVHVQMSGPQFAGPTKWQLDAEPARIAVQEVVTRALKAAPWWWDRLHEALG